MSYVCIPGIASLSFSIYAQGCLEVILSPSLTCAEKKKAKQIQMGLGVHKGLSIKHLELFLRITAVYALNLQ